MVMMRMGRCLRGFSPGMALMMFSTVFCRFSGPSPAEGCVDQEQDLYGGLIMVTQVEAAFRGQKMRRALPASAGLVDGGAQPGLGGEQG